MIVDLIVFTPVAALVLVGLWLLWHSTAEAWQQYAREDEIREAEADLERRRDA